MKKLLLILLCLPMIGFGQNDKIIFSSGDTIIGKVIEVGVNDITYQHKNETTNNISKKRALAKVIYSSGRIETFQGLKILETKISRENNDKLYIEKKKAKKKNTKNLNSKNWGFKIGATSFFPFSRKDEIIVLRGTKGNEQRAESFDLYSARIGINAEVQYNHKINEKISIVNSLAYYTVKFKNEFGIIERVETNQYLSFSLMGLYPINNKLSILSGISLDKIFYSKMIFKIDTDDLPDNPIFSPAANEGYIKVGSHISFVFSTKYTIFKQFYIYNDIKIPLSFLKSLSKNEGSLYRILENNRYLALGIGLDL